VEPLSRQAYTCKASLAFVLCALSAGQDAWCAVQIPHGSALFVVLLLCLMVVLQENTSRLGGAGAAALTVWRCLLSV
jgi:hypothetical protein